MSLFHIHLPSQIENRNEISSFKVETARHNDTEDIDSEIIWKLELLGHNTTEETVVIFSLIGS